MIVLHWFPFQLLNRGLKWNVVWFSTWPKIKKNILLGILDTRKKWQQIPALGIYKLHKCCLKMIYTSFKASVEDFWWRLERRKPSVLIIVSRKFTYFGHINRQVCLENDFVRYDRWQSQRNVKSRNTAPHLHWYYHQDGCTSYSELDLLRAKLVYVYARSTSLV